MILANEVERGLWRSVLLAALARDSDDAVGDADRATLAYRERTAEAHGYVEDPEPCPCRAKVVMSGCYVECTKCGQRWSIDLDDPVDACADMAEHADEIAACSGGEREGPTITIRRSCDNCRYCEAEYYTSQGDSGFVRSCMLAIREIGTTSATPDWCPVAPVDGGEQ